jgi:hypothetical protein
MPFDKNLYFSVCYYDSQTGGAEKCKAFRHLGSAVVNFV